VTLPLYRGLWGWQGSWPPTWFTHGAFYTNRAFDFNAAHNVRVDIWCRGSTLIVIGDDALNDTPQKSTDGGETWADVLAAGYYYPNGAVGAVGHYDSDGDLLMAWCKTADDTFHVLRSSNGGGAWSDIFDATLAIPDIPILWEISGESICMPTYVWEPDSDILLIAGMCPEKESGAQCRIRYSATGGGDGLWCSKMGDWYSEFATWSGSDDEHGLECGVVPLPRIGDNAYEEDE